MTGNACYSLHVEEDGVWLVVTDQDALLVSQPGHAPQIKLDSRANQVVVSLVETCQIRYK